MFQNVVTENVDPNPTTKVRQRTLLKDATTDLTLDAQFPFKNTNMKNQDYKYVSPIISIPILIFLEKAN